MMKAGNYFQNESRKIGGFSIHCLLRIFFSALLFFIALRSDAATKTWFSTTAGGAWTTASNWGGSVPVAGDDIVINISGSGNYTITAVSSLAFASVTVGGSGTGTVTLQSSASTGSFGVFTVNANTTLTGFGTGGITLTGTIGAVASGKLLTVGSSASLKMTSGIVFTVNGTITTTSAANANPFSTVSTSNLVISNNGIINYNGGASIFTTALMTVNAGGILNIISTNTVTLSAIAVSGKISINSTGSTAISTSGTAPVYAAGSTLEYLNCTAIPENVKAWPTTSEPTNVIINSPNGVTITASRIVSGTLTLTAGILTTTASTSLSVTNTASTGITGGSTSSFINGPVKWSLASGTAYNFPVGKGGTYYPFAITPAGTASVLVEAFNTGCGGTADGTTLTSISATEYWSASVASGSITGAVVGLTRQIAVGTFDAIGRSSAKTGVYASLGGSAGTNSISGSNSTGSSLGYFVMGATNSCITPTAFSVTGGGSYCSGGTGVNIGLSGSQAGVSYQLYNGTNAVGNAVAGTGSAISFNTQTAAGTYNVQTTTAGGYCAATMTGNATITVNTTPATPVITQNGNVLHSNSTSGNQWYDQNGIISGATGQNYTPVANGTYYVIVTTSGCSSSASNSIIITSVGIEEAENYQAINIFPNPASDRLFVNFNQIKDVPKTIKIYNVFGQLCIESSDAGHANNAGINISQLSAGTYTVQIGFENGVVNKKFIIK